MSDGDASPSPRTPPDGLTPRPSLDLCPALAAAAAAGADCKVMAKLSKWGAYEARGQPVGDSRLIPVSFLSRVGNWGVRA